MMAILSATLVAPAQAGCANKSGAADFTAAKPANAAASQPTTAPATASTPATQPDAAAQDAQQQDAPKIPPDQLDSLVAPIALYPDPMLSQTLVASTYPLEIIQLQQWLMKHKDLKDKKLVDAVSKQP